MEKLTSTPTSTSTKLRRRISDTMREALLECKKAAMMNKEPYEAGSLRYAKGLINRGLLEPRPYISSKGKHYTAVYITQSGESYLNSL